MENKIRSAEIKPHKYGQMTVNKVEKVNRQCETSGYPHAKTNKQKRTIGIYIKL